MTEDYHPLVEPLVGLSLTDQERTAVAAVWKEHLAVLEQTLVELKAATPPPSKDDLSMMDYLIRKAQARARLGWSWEESYEWSRAQRREKTRLRVQRFRQRQRAKA